MDNLLKNNKAIKFILPITVSLGIIVMFFFHDRGETWIMAILIGSFLIIGNFVLLLVAVDVVTKVIKKKKN